MTTAVQRTAILLGATLVATALGCGKADPTAQAAGVKSNQQLMMDLSHGVPLYDPQAIGLGAASPTDPGAGGAPTFGDATGTGFHTGDAAHSGGTGSGLMGFHGTGALGTSAAISDMHTTEAPPKNAPAFILPEQ